MKTRWLMAAVAAGLALAGGRARALESGIPVEERLNERLSAVAQGGNETAYHYQATLGDPAAGLESVQWIKGGPVNMAAGRGKMMYVIDFWGIDCAPCVAEIPLLTALQKKYAGQVTLAGVTADMPEEVQAFVEKMGDEMDYAVGVDPSGKTGKGYQGAYGILPIPSAFVVDRSGAVVWAGYGSDATALEAVIDQVLAGKYDLAAAQKQAQAEKRLEQYADLQDEASQTDLQAIRVQPGANSGVVDPQQEQAAEKLRAQAAQVGDAIMADAAGDAGLLNALAWFILNTNWIQHRDVALGLKAAQAAKDASGGNEPVFLDTYALGLFYSGQVNAAIQAEQEAVNRELYKKPYETMAATLKKYQAKAAAASVAPGGVTP